MDEDVFPSSSGHRIRDGLLAETAMSFTTEQVLKTDTLRRSSNSRVDLSRGDLIRLLSYLEGELQARDIVIATLKAEKAKQLLYQAKYGRLGLNDPLAALQRDSETCGAKDDFDETAVGRMYESQLAQLERLISAQRRAHHRAKQVLSAAERRHARTIRELEQEKQRKAADAAQGDDVCMMLEKEREKLTHAIEYQKKEQDKLEENLKKARESLEEEKDRHKAMVLYLLNERKQLMTRLMEEKQKSKPKNASEKLSTFDSPAPSTSRKNDFVNKQQQGAGNNSAENVKKLRTLEEKLKELEKQMENLRTERDGLKKQLDSEREETASLKEIVRTQEEDLSLIRQNILAKTRQLAERTQQQQQQLAETQAPKLGPRKDSGQSRPAPPAYIGPQRPNTMNYRPSAPTPPSGASPTATASVPSKYPLTTHYGGVGRSSAPSVGPRVMPVAVPSSTGNSRSTTPFPVNSEDMRQVGVKTSAGVPQTRHLPHQYASTGSIQGLSSQYSTGPGQSNTLPGLRTSLSSASQAKPGITVVARPTVLSSGGAASSTSTFALKRQGSAPGTVPPVVPPPPAYANSSPNSDQSPTTELAANATYPGNARNQPGNLASSMGQGGVQQGRHTQYARLPVGRGQQGNGTVPGTQGQRRQSGSGPSGSPQEAGIDHKENGPTTEAETSSTQVEPEIARLEAVINSMAADVQRFGAAVTASAFSATGTGNRNQLAARNGASSLTTTVNSKSGSQDNSVSVNSGGVVSAKALPVISANLPLELQPSANSDVITSKTTANQSEAATDVAATTAAVAANRFHMIPGRLVRPASASALANGSVPTDGGRSTEKDGRRMITTVMKRTPTPLPAYRVPLPVAPPTNGPTGIPISTTMVGNNANKIGTIKKNPPVQGVNKVAVGGSFKIGRSGQKKATQV